MEKRKACVVGTGNSAHVTAGLVASLPDWDCHVYAPRKDYAELWTTCAQRGGIQVCYGPDDDNLVVRGAPARVSKRAAEVVPGCEILLFCLPAQAYDDNARDIAPYVDEGAMIGTICGVNGVDWCVHAAMHAVGRAPDSYGVFALQNLPWACRTDEAGMKASVLGAKPFMELVVQPESRAEEVSQTLERLIRIPCPPVPGGFLGVGLSNLCQVIHPAVMHGNFESWDGETPFEEKPLFYQGLSEEAANNMSRVSDEILALRAEIEKRVPGIDLSIVHHIFQWTLRAYGKYITDESTLRTRFSTNKAYVGLTCPMLPAPGGGWVPDFQARYLTEDVPYNLVAMKGLGLLLGVETPTIDKMITWAQRVIGKEYLVDGQLTGRDLGESFAPQRFGFRRFEDIPEVRALLGPGG